MTLHGIYVLINQWITSSKVCWLVHENHMQRERATERERERERRGTDVAAT
jgi:hypothetical protein